MLEVPIPVWEQERCVKVFAQIIYDTCMCAAAYEGGKDSCQVINNFLDAGFFGNSSL